MQRRWFLPGHALWGVVAGALLAVSTPVVVVLVASLWISVFIELVHIQPVGQRWRKGLAIFSVQGVALAAVISAAALAPVKTQDRFLQHPVMLPKTELTLGELKELTETRQLQIPILRSISFPESEAKTVVRWPTRELTLRQFIASIEEQTQLRHRFWNCGVGGTILWGGNCSFGMHLYVPNEEAG